MTQAAKFFDRAVPVRTDTRVALAFQGLTGLAEVSLSGGAADAAPLVADRDAPPTLYAAVAAVAIAVGALPLEYSAT